MPTDLQGLPIAITGASSGIGRVTALQCARAGMPVVVGARREDRLRELVVEIERGGGKAIAVPCDVRRPEDCESLVRVCVERFGTIYAVFANAGYGIEGEIHETRDADLREIFEVNFWGTLNTIRPAMPHLLGAGRGHVLICSSVVSKLSIPMLGAYCATKAAQDHIGRAMRIELDGRVFVSTVHPIGTDTEFSQRVSEHIGNRARIARSPERFRQSADVVGAAVVGCLRRPRGEVWTSFPARALAAFATLCPETADALLRRHLRRKLRAIGR